MKKSMISSHNSTVVITTKTTISTSTSAVKRLYQYFKDHPDEIIDIDVLEAVAGIRDWTRAIRFVRADYELKIDYVKPTDTQQAGYIYRRRLAV